MTEAEVSGHLIKVMAQAGTRKVETETRNRHNALFLRSAIPGPARDERLQPATNAVAGLIGARPDEVALCAGGTEALYALIANFVPLNAGDAAIMADIDYDEMQHAMRWLICPLLSGPESLLFWTTKEFGNGQEAQAGRDYRQAA